MYLRNLVVGGVKCSHGGAPRKLSPNGALFWTAGG